MTKWGLFCQCSKWFTLKKQIYFSILADWKSKIVNYLKYDEKIISWNTTIPAPFTCSYSALYCDCSQYSRLEKGIEDIHFSHSCNSIWLYFAFILFFFKETFYFVLWYSSLTNNVVIISGGRQREEP